MICLHWQSADHGNMFGVFEFVAEAYKHKNEDGIIKSKTIVGCEFYITDRSSSKNIHQRRKRSTSSPDIAGKK